jgi:pyridoxine kinase
MLHERGAPHVIITSTNVSTDIDGMLTLYGSTRLSSSSTPRTFRLKLPKLDGRFTGTGDFFAALIVAHSATRHQDPEGWLALACEKAIGTMQMVLRRTLEHAAQTLSGGLGALGTVGGGGHNDGSTSAEQVRALELRLVQSRDAIETPQVQLRATTVVRK